MPDTSACGSPPGSWSAATSASAGAATAASLSSSITLWALTATDIRRRTGPTGSGCGSPPAAGAARTGRPRPPPPPLPRAPLRAQGIALCRPGRRGPGIPLLMGAEDKALHPGIPLGLIRQVVHRLGDQGCRAGGGTGIDLGVGGLLGAARRHV